MKVYCCYNGRKIHINSIDAGNGFFGSSGCRPLTGIMAFILLLLFFLPRKILSYTALTLFLLV